jgi:PAS domain S-box-containing protein
MTNKSDGVHQMVSRLSQGERLFRQLADAIPQTLVWTSSSDGLPNFVNEFWQEYTGTDGSNELAVHATWSSFVHPDDRNRWNDLWLPDLASPLRQNVEVRLMRFDGVYRWFQVCVEPIQEAGVIELRWLGRGTDIDDEKRQTDEQPPARLSPPSTEIGLDIAPSKLAQQAALASGDRYRRLFESIDQGFCLVQLIFDEHHQPVDYRIVEGNSAFRELTGLRDIGDKPVRQMLPDLEFWWVETYGRIATTGVAERFEYYASPMGKWFEVFAFRFGDPQEHQVAIFFKDVTARRESDAEIAEYRRRLDTALIAGEVGTFEWDVVEDRIWGDQNFCRIFSVEMKRSGVAPITHYLQAIHPDDRNQVNELINKTLSTGCDYAAEYRIVQNDSLRWVVARGKAVYDENGEVSRFPGIVLDVTDRKLAELALRESRELLNSIIDNAEIAIYAKGLDGRFILSNRRHAELLGYETKEILGRYDHDFKSEPENFKANDRKVIEANRPIEFEEAVPTASGDRDFVSIKFPLRDASGKSYAVCGISTDITERKRAEAQLRRSQERLRLAQQAAGIGTFEWDIRNGSIEWSPELESLYGLPEGGFKGTYDAWISYVHPEDRAGAERCVREACNTTQFQAEFRIVRPDGSVRWLAARGKVDQNDAGKPLRMLGINIDVTDRELANLALRESEKRFRDLANAMPQLVWTADESGEVTYYNSQASRYQGIEQVSEDLWHWRPILHPNDIDQTVEVWKAAVASGSVYECEHRVHMLDGSYRWHLSRAFRVVSSKKAQWYGTATDIHELKIAEQAMRESEERFRMLADNMSQFAWMADRSGRIVWFNRRWFDYTGTTNEDMQHRGWLSVIHRDYVDSVVDHFQECLRAGTDWEDTFPIRASDGNYSWFLCRAVPIRDDGGTITRWFGTNTDVTEFRRIEAELRRAQQLAEVANRAKSDFLANMSHEIRSPMTAIIGYADLLTTEDPGDREKIETIRSNGQYLLTLINDILDLSKIEAGKLGLDLVEFSPRMLVDEVYSLMQVRASESGLAFTQEFTTQIPKKIKSDPLRIRQVLINLVGNAIKFTESGSVKMVVSFDDINSEFAIDVIDTGIGMSPDEMQRLFQPFSQADATISRRFGGSGLGLAISQRLAGLLNGHINVSSEVNQGSRFTLVLPIEEDVELEWATQEDEAPAADKKDRQLTSGQLQIRVLVVEDRRDVRFLIQSFIRKVGGETVLCENGAEAIAIIEADQQASNVFDVVLMDMQMPVMDGITTVRQLRSNRYDRPIIALTANALQSDRDLCLEAGYTDYLSKPIDVQHLIEILRVHTTN